MTLTSTLSLPRILFLAVLLSPSFAFDADQLEVFDVVEEVGQNFYELLGVSETAPTAEIKKAYRKASLLLHPDRNPAEDAEVKFRQLVAVYEILKNDEKRGLYDSVLRDGLPDWRQPVFYYRKARKLGLLELAIILALIFTVGHYLVIWAVYLERKFEMEEVLFSQLKRKHDREHKRRRDRHNADLDKVAEGVSEMVTGMLEAPTLGRLLPVQLGLGLAEFLRSTPERLHAFQIAVREWMEEMKRRKEVVVEEEEDEVEDETEDSRKRPKRKRVELPEWTGSSAEARSSPSHNPTAAPSSTPSLPSRAFEPWSEDDLSKLSKAMARFPAGTLNRWDKVAEFVDRTVGEILAKNKELRDARYHHLNDAAAAESSLQRGKKSARAMAALPSEATSRSEDDAIVVTPDPSIPVAAASPSTDVQWTQNQQKIFEWALTQYPKGTPERWDKIAEHIPGVTKADCVQRFKFIVESLKRKKQ